MASSCFQVRVRAGERGREEGGLSLIPVSQPVCLLASIGASPLKPIVPKPSSHSVGCAKPLRSGVQGNAFPTTPLTSKVVRELNPRQGRPSFWEPRQPLPTFPIQQVPGSEQSRSQMGLGYGRGQGREAQERLGPGTE